MKLVSSLWYINVVCGSVYLLRAETKLTLTLLTWRIWWAPNNASRWQMGFNSAFKVLIYCINVLHISLNSKVLNVRHFNILISSHHLTDTHHHAQRWCVTGYLPISYHFNLLKPSGYVMHQQFNIQQLYALSTLHLCVLYLSENKQRLVPLTA